MDELEKCVADYCAHTAPSDQDWVLKMAELLLGRKDFPMMYADREKIYKNASIPRRVITELEGRAFWLAYDKWHNKCENILRTTSNAR